MGSKDRLDAGMELDKLIGLYDGGGEISVSLAEHRYMLVRAARGIVKSAQIAKTGGKLTATTFGHEIKAPFGGLTLVDDEPRRGRLIMPDFELVSPFKESETSYLKVAELVRRGRYEPEFAGCDECGTRDLDDLWRHRGEISVADWPVGLVGFAVASGWEDAGGSQFFEFLYRLSVAGWVRDCRWSRGGAHGHCRLLRRKKFNQPL